VVLTVFLVDDHEAVRRAVAELLDEEEDLRVVGEAGSVAEALTRIPVLEPDIAVLDLRLPDGNGIELCRELRSRMPHLACVMLTSCADQQAIREATLAGVELAWSLRMVAAGRTRPAPAGVLAERSS
jgi:two-component system response regulator DevR